MGILGASLLGNLLIGQRVYRAGERKGIVRAGYRNNNNNNNNNNKIDF